ncbi:hypothetical protein [Peteryoungia ipomoeae]|uniref:Uncharacterized protein n=1 Tax=Peteryoungia ipomoeae TaxID=1210932 RepID=A0A4V4HND3_9HYPH|nr:hypothetical protein [Peteryoungia ipomoeae]THV25596.1 hypothetical protein FAA97_05255 [Peteryoungia ipomoeae]
MSKVSIIALAFILAASTQAQAISRYNSTQLTCDAVRERVLNERAVILRYPSTRVRGMTLYDRYVTRNAECAQHEYAERAYVPTRDTDRCPVLNCQDYDPRPGRFGKPNIRF